MKGNNPMQSLLCFPLRIGMKVRRGKQRSQLRHRSTREIKRNFFFTFLHSCSHPFLMFAFASFLFHFISFLFPSAAASLLINTSTTSKILRLMICLFSSSLLFGTSIYIISFLHPFRPPFSPRIPT